MSKTIRHLWIDRKLYLIPRSTKDVLMSLEQIFLSIEDINGNITFDGRKFKLNNVDIFERFVIHWLLGMASGESDPILNDESGMPVELRINDDKGPRKDPKVFSHEKKE